MRAELTCVLCGRKGTSGIIPADEGPVCVKVGRCKRGRRSVNDRWVMHDGYVVVQTENGARVEHRHVMEQALGRRLVPGETVHHKNRLRHDNRLENLELWFSAQPRGARVDDMINYLVTHHRAAVNQALTATDAPMLEIVA